MKRKRAGPGERGSGTAGTTTRTCVRNVVRWVGKYVSVLGRRLLLYRVAREGVQIMQLVF